ncbi:MAG: alpha/beta hydrolase family esterase [Flavobacteriaceae bacterium]
MKKSLIAILLIFSCSSETVEDPISTVDPTDSTDPVVTVEYGLQEFEIEFQGITRSYNIFVPDSYDPFDPVPLLFCLHAWSSSNEIIMAYTEFNDIASEENFIVVYPQGSYFNGTTHWNVGGWTQGSSVEDVAFIDF